MASTVLDIRNGTVPHNSFGRTVEPDITSLFTAISGAAGMSAKYPNLAKYSRNSLLQIAKMENITVPVADAVDTIVPSTAAGAVSTWTNSPDNTKVSGYSHSIVNG